MFRFGRLCLKFTIVIGVGLLVLLFFVDFETISLNTEKLGSIIKSISSLKIQKNLFQNVNVDVTSLSFCQRRV